MRIRKISLIAAVALGALLACTNVSLAQDANKNGKEGKKGRGFSAQARVDRMATELNLTADQKTKLTALFDEETKKMRDLRSDTNSTPEQRREKFRGMREENDKKLKEILTPEQWDKWQKSREQMRPPRGPGGGEKKEKKNKE